jgi:hypothetical protein
MLILKIFLDKKSAKYFLRNTHFNFTTFEFEPLWSGGGAALFRIFKSPANGGGGRGGGDLLPRRSPPLAEVILGRPSFFFSLSLPGSPWRIGPSPAVKSSLNCRL